jgi:hypothetical protein
MEIIINEEKLQAALILKKSNEQSVKLKNFYNDNTKVVNYSMNLIAQHVVDSFEHLKVNDLKYYKIMSPLKYSALLIFFSFY